MAGRAERVEELIMPQKLWERAEKALSSKLESVVFLFGRVRNGKLLATDVLVPNEDDYEERTSSYVKVSQKFAIKEFPRLESQGKTLIAALHSHPIEGLSPIDIDTHLKAIKCYPYQLTGIYYQGKVCFYRSGAAEACDEEKSAISKFNIEKVPHRIFESGKFDRQVRILGEEGQLLISTSTIALIGVGGVNSKVAFDLASLGIGKLILIDPDVWEETNRTRVFIPPSHVGMNKAESVKRLIESYYPDIKVEAFAKGAEDLPEELYAYSDIFMVCPDRVTARIFSNRLALRLKKPALFLGVGISDKEGKLMAMGSSVQVVIPGNSACFECIYQPKEVEMKRELLSEETRKRLAERYGLKELLESPIVPSIASLNSVTAGLAVWEVIKLITGVDKPTHLQVYDALSSELRRIEVAKNPNCPACSVKGNGSFPEIKSTQEVLSWGAENWT